MPPAHLLYYLLGEVIALPVFWMIRRHFGEGRPPVRVTAMGMIERLVLFVGLSMGIQTIVVLVGAIKIGTRIAPQEEDMRKVKADYFVIGNLVSVLVVLLDLLLVKWLGA
ncbi:MAG: hypothetical protein WAT74_14595 [Flavobacteriales bacterium]